MGAVPQDRCRAAASPSRRSVGRWLTPALCLAAAGLLHPLSPGFCAAASPTASASSPEAAGLRTELAQRAARAGLSETEVRGILARVDRLQAGNLPAAPVIDRYLEGFSKGVPLPRIEAAVDQLCDRLQISAGFVDGVFPRPQTADGQAARASLIDYGAFALGAGASADALKGTLSLASADRTGAAGAGAPVLALGVMVTAGLSADRSADVVRTAWNHGYRGGELQRLGQDLAALGRDGKAPPPEAVDRVMTLLQSGQDHDAVFQNLDEMHAPGGHPGYNPPGSGPGEDPNHMHGGGAPPGGRDDHPGGGNGHHGGH